MLVQQDLLVSELKEIMTTINSSKEDRPKRVRVPHHHLSYEVLSECTVLALTCKVYIGVVSFMNHLAQNILSRMKKYSRHDNFAVYSVWSISLFFFVLTNRSRSCVVSSPLVLNFSNFVTPSVSPSIRPFE